MHARALTAIIFLCAFSLWGCERDVNARASALPVANATSDEAALGELGASIGEQIERARARLEQDLDPPDRNERVRCPDELLATREGGLTIPVRVTDGRIETRSPLPLNLVASLETDEFSPILAHLTGGAAAHWDPTRAKPRDPTSARAAEEGLRQLLEQRYLGELRVERYSEPKLFRRKDAIRSEWNPGHVIGRFIVYDLAESKPLCQAPVVVLGDAADAPIRRRLRESTRQKLMYGLIEKTWASMQAALATVSNKLVLPPESRRNDPDNRWAADPKPNAERDSFEAFEMATRLP